MDEPPKHSAFLPDLIRLPGYILDFRREELRKETGEICELRPQAFAVLKYLALNAERLVTKEELLAEIWRGTLVTDDSLVQAIGDVRRAINDSQHRLIKTVPRRGYMLAAANLTPSGRAAEKPAATDVTRASPMLDSNAGEPGVPLVGNGRGVPDEATAAAPYGVGRRQQHAHPALAYLYRRLRLLLASGMMLAVIAIGVWVIFQNDHASTSNDGFPPSIAVLPFKGAPAERGNEELARDVAAELASELARSPELRVISAQSSFQVSPAETSLSEIGRRLNSRYLVDGKIRRDAEQLRIIVQLLDSQSGQVMWSSSHTVDRTMLGAAQQIWASRIAGTLQSKMSHFEERRALAQPPKTLDVVVLTARAKSMMHRYSAEGVRESRRLLQQALSIDPDYAPAWAFLSLTNTIDAGLKLTGERGAEFAPEILAQARRAVTLQPDMPMGYEALTNAEAFLGNLDAALAAGQQCLRISPNDAMCFFALGDAQLRMGQVKLAARSFEQALERNPLPPTVLTAFYATALWASGRLEEAVRVAEECLAKAPDFWRCRQDRIAALVELGRHREAREEAALLRARHPEMSSRQFALKWADAAAVFGERRSAAARAVGFP